MEETCDKCSNKNKAENNKWIIPLLAVSGIWVIYSITSLLLTIPSLGPPNESFNFGEFGDSFGALNALFAGLAFAGMLIAIFLQRKDIKIQSEALNQQIEEIKLQNDVLELQRKEQKDTREVMRKQSFEDTFFKLLSLHHEIVNAMTESIHFPVSGNKGNQKTFTGTQYLQHLYMKMHQKISDETKAAVLYEDKKEKTVKTIIAGVTFCEEHQFVLGHYFRNLYQIIKFINESGFNKKHFYSDIIRAQLSSAELDLLFYNCLSMKGSKFKYYVEEFTLLKHLSIDEELKKLYSDSAYEDKEPIKTRQLSPNYLHPRATAP